MAFAHTREGSPQRDWQTLDQHLEGVSKLASDFASSFGAAGWGRLAGLWHDLGKNSDAFQSYLAGSASDPERRSESRGSVDHSSAGAQHAVATVPLLGHLLGFAIAGHHSGLHDGRSDGSCLESRLRKVVEPWESDTRVSLDTADLSLPPFLVEALGKRQIDPRGTAFSVAFFVRMLFSCLVDADFLDTERFMDPARTQHRSVWPSDVLQQMEGVLDGHMAALEDGTPSSVVNEVRRRVRQSCLDAAELPPGLFSLTVPTGGGKTLASLAFALRHARLHGLQRVLYVIPFTSIIEQNAEVFRQVLAPLISRGQPDPVLEHHCNVDQDGESVVSRLAIENWDAPLVVTTAVQFYESLFGNRTSRCRKLHNVARTVIILDEAQSLPVDFLEPCLAALRELTDHYGATVVLCTATQPAVGERSEFPIGLKGVQEIVPDPPEAFSRLRRVEVEDCGLLEDHELVARIRGLEQVLCVVNTRRHARELFGEFDGSEGARHLSASMCPEHRSEILSEVRACLERGAPCRVVSTQLIEAGVDIDFPVVFRSLAGLDSIAQAAGRCNREGKLDALGKTFVFRSEHRGSERFLADTANVASQVLALGGDPLSLEAVERYFKLYYWDQNDRWDHRNVLDSFHIVDDRVLPFLFDFATVAQRFRLIEETGHPVIIPWGQQGKELCDELRAAPAVHGRSLLRRLQRFTVQIHDREWNAHLGRSIELVHDRFPVLVSPEVHYSERTGLVLDETLPGLLMA